MSTSKVFVIAGEKSKRTEAEFKARDTVLGYVTGRSLFAKVLERVGALGGPECGIYIHYVPPMHFTPVKGKVNVLFTMWESHHMPEDMMEYIMPADFVIVPSENSRRAIKWGGYPKTIYTCRLGIDVESFPFIERERTPEKFQFLWVGAPGFRKGYDLMLKAWLQTFVEKGINNVELIIKSTVRSGNEYERDLPKFQAKIDVRKLSREELCKLYHKSHVFLFPSRGEGQGLPPLEAMSTGLPVLGPAWSGMKDYMDKRHSYPIKYNLVDMDYGCVTRMADIDIEDAGMIMMKVYKNYPQALSKGRKASKFVREHFSLDSMGERALEIIDKIERRIQ